MGDNKQLMFTRLYIWNGKEYRELCGIANVELQKAEIWSDGTMYFHTPNTLTFQYDLSRKAYLHVEHDIGFRVYNIRSKKKRNRRRKRFKVRMLR